MNEFRNLILRLMQVIWVIFAMCVVLAIGALLISLFAPGVSIDDIFGGILGFSFGSLVFIFSMLSIQYILFSSWNLNDLFDGSLMR